MVKQSFNFFQASVAGSLVICATVISFREYFLVNPFAGNFGLVSSLQAISLVSLLILVLVPPLVLGSSFKPAHQKSNLLIFAALAWPVSLMLVRIAIWQATGLFVVDYWISYPILFLCEFGASAVYLYVAIAQKSFSQIRTPIDYTKSETIKI